MIRPWAKPLSVRTRILFPAPKRLRMVATIRSKARTVPSPASRRLVRDCVQSGMFPRKRWSGG